MELALFYQRGLSSPVSILKGLVINNREGGGAKKWENCRSKTFCEPPPPPPQDFYFVTPFNMAKTSRYRIKTTPKLFVPPPPPLFVGIKLHIPSPPMSRFVAPPPPRN